MDFSRRAKELDDRALHRVPQPQWFWIALALFVVGLVSGLVGDLAFGGDWINLAMLLPLGGLLLYAWFRLGVRESAAKGTRSR